MIYITLIIGLAVLLLGASKLVDASVAIAGRTGLSPFVTGAVIVGIGTSAPELVVTTASSIAGNCDMAMGNVLGSNICNGLLVLGLAAIICPFTITRPNLRRDLPMAFFASLLVMILCQDSIFPGIDDNEIGRVDGIFLVALFAAYIGYNFYASKRSAKPGYEAKSSWLSKRPMWLLVTLAVVSLIALIVGGEVFLNSATEIALNMGISQKVISITLLAVGTSLPEMVTCVIAAAKGNPQLALGNVIGSNVTNLLLVLGVAGTCRPIVLTDVRLEDFGVLIFGAALTFVFAFTFKRNFFDRIEGAILVILYILYISYLVAV